MPLKYCARWGLMAMTAALLLAMAACGGGSNEPAVLPKSAGSDANSAEKTSKTAPVALKNEIPPDELEAVMAAHYQGLGHDGAL